MRARPSDQAPSHGGIADFPRAIHGLVSTDHACPPGHSCGLYRSGHRVPSGGLAGPPGRSRAGASTLQSGRIDAPERAHRRSRAGASTVQRGRIAVPPRPHRRSCGGAFGSKAITQDRRAHSANASCRVPRIAMRHLSTDHGDSHPPPGAVPRSVRRIQRSCQAHMHRGSDAVGRPAVRIGKVLHGDPAIQRSTEQRPIRGLPKIAQGKSQDPAGRVRHPARSLPRSRTHRNLRAIGCLARKVIFFSCRRPRAYFLAKGVARRCRMHRRRALLWTPVKPRR